MSEFYAAFVQSSYHVEGDERSRTNPGHGYPAHTVDYQEVIEFATETEMTNWVKSQESSVFSRKKYKIVKCTPMVVTSTIEVRVSVK